MGKILSEAAKLGELQHKLHDTTHKIHIQFPLEGHYCGVACKNHCSFAKPCELLAHGVPGVMTGDQRIEFGQLLDQIQETRTEIQITQARLENLLRGPHI